MKLKRMLGLAAGAAALVLVVAGTAVAAGGPPPWVGQGTPAASGTLTSAERNALVYMVEEEKLARDVYAKLAKSYPSATVFARIVQAEQRHMNAVARQLSFHRVANPTAGKAAGDFENGELQRLYDTLTVRGAASLSGALQVGVTIEKADIADLQGYLRSVENGGVKRVFTNLLRGSQSHLRAFTSGTDGNCTCNGTQQRNGNGPRGRS